MLLQPALGEPHYDSVITIDGHKLANSDKSPYLSSTMSNTATIDEEINLRLARASASFGRLSDRVWKKRGLTCKTKLKVYHAVVLPSLLYGSETWTVYSRHLQRLQSFHLRCLRQILKVKWQDRVSNTEILQRAKSCILMEAQLRCYLAIKLACQITSFQRESSSESSTQGVALVADLVSGTKTLSRLL